MTSTALLLSGGVDSAVALHLFKEQGITPDLYYINIGPDPDQGYSCSKEEDTQICRMLAKRYGANLEIVDLHKEYWENVVGYIITQVKRGLTPNPDVMCNRLIKFGCFEDLAGSAYEHIATGHYASRIHYNGQDWLGAAKDPVKDQTDFLAQITHTQFAKSVFPLGHLMKSEVRTIAQGLHLPPASRRDSQGICFLGNLQYKDLVGDFLGKQPGQIVDYTTGKILGTHEGHWFHTIGQRKGLGLSGGPWYCVQKDIDANIVYVSKGRDESVHHFVHEVQLNGFHTIAGIPWDEEWTTRRILYKPRHTPEFGTATLYKNDGQYKLHFDETPVDGIAPGQFAVIYTDTPSGRICVGSGEMALLP